MTTWHSTATDPKQTWVSDKPVRPSGVGRGRPLTVLADQAVASLSNFVVTIWIARAIGPSQFGRFALAYSAWLLFLGIQRSLIVEPMIIIGGQYSSVKLFGFLRKSAQSAAAFAAICGALLTVAGLIGGYMGVGTYATVLIPLGVALVPMMMQDFWRWRHLVVPDPKAALVNDLLFAAAEIAAIAIIDGNHRLTAATGLLGIGAGALCASCIGVFQSRQPFAKWTAGAFAQLREKWGLGRWLLADFFTVWLYTQGTFFVVAALAGSHGTGVYRALDGLFGPSRTALLGVVSVTLPASARLIAQDGEASLDRWLRIASFLILTMTCAYGMLLSVFSSTLVSHLYGGKYSAYSLLLIPMAIGFVFFSLQMPATIGLKALRRPDALFRARLFVALTAISAVAVGTRIWGIWGTAWGGVLGGSTAAWLPAMTYARERKRRLSVTAGESVPLRTRPMATDPGGLGDYLSQARQTASVEGALSAEVSELARDFGKWAPGGPLSSVQDGERILYIGGYGRSGSTLIGRLLAQSTSSCFVGELRLIWLDGLTRNRRCGCGSAFRECEFWERVGDEAFGGWSTIDPVQAIHTERKVARHRNLTLVLGSKAMQRSEELRQYVERLTQLYTAVHRVSGSKLIIDSSKSGAYALMLTRACKQDVRVVNVIRDSRGTAYSWSKRTLEPSVVGDVGFMPRFGGIKAAVEWDSSNLLFSAMRLSGTPSEIMRYEDFVIAPVEHLERLMTLAGLDVREGTFEFLTRDAADIPLSHSIGGNPMRFQEGPIRMRVDDEWVRKMTRRQRLLVTALTWPMLQIYSYPLRRTSQQEK